MVLKPSIAKDHALLSEAGDGVMPQANFPWKITFDMLYTNGFSIRIHSRTLSISSERNLYDKYIELVIIDLELMLRPQETIRINWH